MSIQQRLNWLYHRRQTAQSAPVRRLAITRTYGVAAVAILAMGGLTMAFAAHGYRPAGSANAAVNNSTGSSQERSTVQTLSQDIQNTPEATDPQSSSEPSIESEGAASSSSHSVSVSSDNSGTSVTVDGQTSTVPAGGSMNQTYTTDGNSPSSVHVSIDNSSQSAAGGSQHSSISVRSRTQAEGGSSSTTNISR